MVSPRAFEPRRGSMGTGAALMPPLVYLGRVMTKSRNHEARQTGSPLAREAVPERASPRLSSGHSPNSRSDQDRMGKDGTRRNAPTAPRDRTMTDTPVFVGVDVAKD